MSTLPFSFKKKTPYTLFSLPGFLGHPSDWQGLLLDNNFWSHVPSHYYGSDNPPPSAGLRSWADNFNRMVTSRTSEKKILLGYSLGGRLAMHALSRTPEIWSGAIFISAHPGLPLEERRARLEADELWARRFETESLEVVLKAWNAQTPFDGVPFPGPRPLNRYDRGLLALTLRHWSLGKQQELAPTLMRLPIPILWIAGEKDLCYSEIASKCVFADPLSQIAIVENAGHRVPWQQPEIFTSLLNEFCSAIQQRELCKVS